MALSNVSSDQSSISVTRKIILVGDAFVGKTCLVNRFFRDTFEDPPRVNLKDPVDEYVIHAYYRMQVWDLKGGQGYRTLNQLYYRGVDAAILCYDADEPGSYHSLRTYWLANIREHIPSCRFYVCATKRDLLSRAAQIQLLEHYLREDRIDAKLYLTSAKTGENVYDMFTDIFVDLTPSGAEQFAEQQKENKINEEQEKLAAKIVSAEKKVHDSSSVD